MGVVYKKPRHDNEENQPDVSASSMDTPISASDIKSEISDPCNSNGSSSNEVVKSKGNEERHVSMENTNETGMDTSSKLSSNTELEEGEISD